jgi:uncharacterized protein YqeY
MLIEEIKKANIVALKNHDQATRGVLSIVISRYQELLTSGAATKPTDVDLIKLIQKFDKELDEEKESYLKAARPEQAAAIDAQKKALAVFLPKSMSEAEIRSVIATLSDKSMPAVMKYFKANYDGKADMSLVSRIVRGL